jgi:hypothetical protein
VDPPSPPDLKRSVTQAWSPFPATNATERNPRGLTCFRLEHFPTPASPNADSTPRSIFTRRGSAPTRDGI